MTVNTRFVPAVAIDNVDATFSRYAGGPASAAAGSEWDRIVYRFVVLLSRGLLLNPAAVVLYENCLRQTR